MLPTPTGERTKMMYLSTVQRLAPESPGVEQKPHDSGNQVTVLVDSKALRNYFDDQLIFQHTSIAYQTASTSPPLARSLQLEDLFCTAPIEDILQDFEGFNDWRGRGYYDFVPGEVTKTTPSGDETTMISSMAGKLAPNSSRLTRG